MGIIGTVIGIVVIIAVISALAPDSISDIDIDLATIKGFGVKIIDTINIWRA